LLARKRKEAATLFDQAKAYANRNDLATALQLAAQAVEKHEECEEAWLLIGRISPDLHERITVLERAFTLNPSNTRTALALKEIRHLNEENIAHVKPTASIARLTLIWPLLYLSLLLMHMGLHPLKHPNVYLWFGLPLVILGGFMLSLVEARSHHMVWQKIFREQGHGSSLARFLTATMG
jgi:hypothetical protein